MYAKESIASEGIQQNQHPDEGSDLEVLVHAAAGSRGPDALDGEPLREAGPGCIIPSKNICSLVKSFVVINQSRWAIVKANTIKTAIINAENLVSKLPKGFLNIPDRIISKPEETSIIGTKVAKKGEKLNHSIKFFAGSGNFWEPWMIKDVPKSSLNNQGAKNL